MRLVAVLFLIVLLSGCALLGFGPPTGVVEGRVQQAPSYAPAAYAEVCVFGSDTTCIRTGRNGHYKIKLTEQTVWLRFRFGNQHPHRSGTVHVVPGTHTEVDCALADRMVLSTDPLPCLPVRGT